MVERCGTLGLPVLPGVATATEVLAARDLGVEAVKFFPAETSGGAPAVAALAAVFGDMRFVPTGGITAAKAGDYLALPSVLAIGGSWMVPRSADLDIVALAVVVLASSVAASVTAMLAIFGIVLALGDALGGLVVTGAAVRRTR